MGAGHFPDLDEALERASVIEKKYKDLRSAEAIRKIVGELRWYRTGQPTPADTPTPQPADKTPPEAESRG